jgi:hypothetical protein
MKKFMAQVKGLAKPSACVSACQKEKVGKDCQVVQMQKKRVVVMDSCKQQHYNRHTENGMCNQRFTGDFSKGNSHGINIAIVFASDGFNMLK